MSADWLALGWPLAIALAALLPPILAPSAPTLARSLAPLVTLGCLVLAGWLVFGDLSLANVPMAVGAPVVRGDRLAGLGALLVVVTLLLFWTRGEDHPDPPRQDAARLLFLAGALGCALATEVLTLALALTLAGLAQLALGHRAGIGRGEIAMTRALLAIALGWLALAAAGALWHARTGSLQFTALALPEYAGPLVPLAFALLLFGAAAFAGLFPWNAWLADYCATVPTRVAVLGAALLPMLCLLALGRTLVGFAPQAPAAALALLIGLLTLLTGEWAAGRMRDLPRLLVWSGIAQLGLALMAFALGGTAGMLAGLLILLHRLVALLALYALARRWNGTCSVLRGQARSAPLAGAAFALCLWSLVGLPPLPGFWTKWTLASALLDTGLAVHGLALAAMLTATVLAAGTALRLTRQLLAPVPSSPPGPSWAFAPRPSRLDTALAVACPVVLLMATVRMGSLASWLAELTDGVLMLG